MKTDDLVALLADRATPVSPHATSRRLTAALLAGGMASLFLIAAVSDVHGDLLRRMSWPGFWIRFALVCMLGAAGFLVMHRLARPGAKVGAAWWGLVLPGAAIWLAAINCWMYAMPREQLWQALADDDWQTCAVGILMASLPVLAAELLALRTLAPTRPALSGAVAGILAGVLGISAHALNCPELSPAVVAVWDASGIVVSMVLGMLLGARFLRW